MGSQKKVVAPRLPLVPTLKLILMSVVRSLVRRKDGTINRLLLQPFEFKVASNPKPLHGVCSKDFTVDPSRNLWVRLFFPAESKPGPMPLAVFFHGGGFVFFTADMPECDFFCRRLCKEFGFPVLSVNYRLAPEHRYPAQYEDGVDVLRFLLQTKTAGFKGTDPLLEEFFQRVDLSRCFVAGDSAGANIAHNVARRWSEGQRTGLQVVGLVAIQPFFGGEERVRSEESVPRWSPINPELADFLWTAVLPRGATRDHPAASPTAAAQGLAESFPAVMVIVGELDPLLDWQLLYYESLKRNGMKAEMLEYPGAIHCFHAFPQLKQSQEVVEDVVAFIHRVCSADNTGDGGDNRGSE